MQYIINIRQCPEWHERAMNYFAHRWNVDGQIYRDSIDDSVSTEKTLPRWYLMLCGDEIIGGFGLIENDFMVREDLRPWLCALYIEPLERGQALGSRLLSHGRREAAKLGFNKVYLNTDHVGYYEKYGWSYMGEFTYQSGTDARVYEADAILELEEMAAFFDARADSYDSHMLDDLGLDEFYETIADCFEPPVSRILDLGCGTGLELERLFENSPNMEVMGIDMSAKMLKMLEVKYPGKKLRLICGSYFDVDFEGHYDHVISTYSLHHFSEKSKLKLYRKIHDALTPGGTFIFGDYTVSSIERQRELLAANDAKRREQGVADGEFYHFDTPFTAETEMKLMKEAGFVSAEIVRRWENTSILIARK